MPYFDHAATTPLDPRVRDAWLELADEPLNPSSIHRQGQRARALLEEARERIAAAIGLADPAQILFASGATEAANMALRGMAGLLPPDERLRVLSSPIEHSCVRDTVAALDDAGRIGAVALPVGESGRVRLDEAPRDRRALLCLMHANNETGVVQDVEAALEWKSAAGSAWLCDAVQSPGRVAFDADALGADFIVLSAHKLHGPPGIGCLAGPGVERLPPLITGGQQEGGRRPGTESVALAWAFARAVELAVERRAEAARHLAQLEEKFLRLLGAKGIAWRVNGDAPRLPGFLNLSFEGYSAVDLAIALDMADCCVSPGAACSTGVVAVSPVLEAMFPLDANRARGGLRLSFGFETDSSEVGILADALGRLIRGKATTARSEARKEPS